MHDGFDATTPPLFKECGATPPAPVTTTSNVAFVHMYSSPIRLGSTFLLEWRQVDRGADPSKGLVKEPGEHQLLAGTRRLERVAYPFAGEAPKVAAGCLPSPSQASTHCGGLPTLSSTGAETLRRFTHPLPSLECHSE